MNESSEAQTNSKANQWITYGLWAVIWGVTLITGLIQHQGGKQRAEAAQASDLSGEPPFQLILTGRYVVGANATTGGLLGGEAEGMSNAPLLLSTLEGQFSSELDRLRALPLAAELSGTDIVTVWSERLAEADLGAQAQQDLELFGKIYGNPPQPLTEVEKSGLKARHGWPAELALVYGLDDDDPARAAILKQAQRTFAAMFLAGVGIFGIMGLGFLLMIIVIARWVNGKPPIRRFRATGGAPHERRPFLEVTTLFLLGFLALPLLFSLLRLDLGNLVLLPLLATPLWLQFRKVSFADIKQGLGWNRGEGFLKEAAMGLLGYLTCLPILLLGFLMTTLLMNLSGTTPAHPAALQLQSADAKTIATIFLMASIAAPLIEETLFRGIFFNYLRGRHGVILSGLLTGVIFAALHPQGWVGIPVLCSIGFVMALLREWRGSLIGPIVAHFANNTVVLSLALMLFA